MSLLWKWIHRIDKARTAKSNMIAFKRQQAEIMAEGARKVGEQVDKDIMSSVYKEAREYTEMMTKHYPDFPFSPDDMVVGVTKPVLLDNKPTDHKLATDCKLEELKEKQSRDAVSWGIKMKSEKKSYSKDGKWEFDGNGGFWRTLYGMTFLDGRYLSEAKS